MTVIAWDGLKLAADRMAVCGGTKRSVRKLYVRDGLVFAWSGELGRLQELMDWHVKGCDPATYPNKGDKEWSRLCVFNPKARTIEVFEDSHIPLPFDWCVPWAWGSGMDYALGAMHAGKCASDAVRAACYYSDSCGLGIDSINLSRKEAQKWPTD